MANGIYVAASGAMAQLRRLEAASNNLAHATEPGYKRDDVTFEDVRAQLRPEADPTLARNRDKQFAKDSGTNFRIEAGPITQTENPLDVALHGDGFLRVRTPDGERLTRDGRLALDAEGTLRTIRGHLVLDEGGGEITLPHGAIPSIDRAGQITAAGVRVGALGVARVTDPAGLSKQPDGMFVAQGRFEDASRDEVDVLQGFIEESNVSAVQAITELVEVQRTFEALHQVMNAYRQMDEQATRLMR